MKSYGYFVISAALALAGTGCAHNQGSANRTVPPAGPVYTAPAPPGVLPAGTDLVLRTNERIDTRQAAAGQVYSAQVDRPIVDVNGRTIVPAGSPAQLVVANTSGGGTLGTPQLELAVRSITVNGRTYNVASDVNQESSNKEGIGANRRTAEMVGGGALLGTLVGAVAGGGAGAAIGAVAGAAAGGAAQVLTKGDHVMVPAETLLTFRLDQPIRLVGYQG